MDIWHASALRSFTDSIRPALAGAGFEGCTLVQIHGAPVSLEEDARILENARALRGPKAFLIHRPDEALPLVREYFGNDGAAKLIFLGDLVLRIPFWDARREFISVIPHPQLDLRMPSAEGKPIVGAFTRWGEMRNIEHYLSLVECLPGERFDFRVGGSGLGALPGHVRIEREPFVPHFNVQLYHLHGKKRYGESSGSLHRGISVPVIFEANGAERLEGMRAIKIEADDDLTSIDFGKAAAEITELAAGGLTGALSANLAAASANSVHAFATSVVSVFR